MVASAYRPMEASPPWRRYENARTSAASSIVMPSRVTGALQTIHFDFEREQTIEEYGFATIEARRTRLSGIFHYDIQVAKPDPCRRPNRPETISQSTIV